MALKLIRRTCTTIFVVFLPVLFLLNKNGVAAAGHNALASSSVSIASLSSSGIESNNSGSNADDVSGTKIALLPAVMAPIAETTTESSTQEQQ